MVSFRKVGSVFHVDWIQGDLRVRGSLGTSSHDIAVRLRQKIESAIVGGPSSPIWPDLSNTLPPETYARFASQLGVVKTQVVTWEDLKALFNGFQNQRLALGKLSPNTKSRYAVAIDEFSLFLDEQKVLTLPEITKALVEKFKVWRMERTKTRKMFRGGGGIAVDAAVLHRVFAIGIEHELLVKNPVRMEGKPGENPVRGAHPFSGDELAALRNHAAEDLLSFLLLRWTGLRGSDAVKVSWREVDWNAGELVRLTQKRKKLVIVPMHEELSEILATAQKGRTPPENEPILISPETGQPMSRPRLYERIKALGERAGVKASHPHRFRDTLAVDLLVRGASPYDVAKILGDKIDTIERHYAPFVPELRRRIRTLFLNPGLEKPFDSGLTEKVPPVTFATNAPEVNGHSDNNLLIRR